MADPAISAKGLCFGFGRQDPLFESVDLSVPNGQSTVLIGPNGCGKSTLVSLLSGVMKPQRGSIELGSLPLGSIPSKALARIIGVLPQSPEAADGLAVRDLVALGRAPHRGFMSLWSRADELAVGYALSAVELTAFADRSISELSGGQRQRAFIAMILAQEPKILFLDEPTSYLDISHQLRILRLLSDLKADRGMTLVTVLHDIAMAAAFADNLVVLSAGKIVAEGPPEDVISEDLLATVFEVEARVKRDRETGQIIVIPVAPTSNLRAFPAVSA